MEKWRSRGRCKGGGRVGYIFQGGGGEVNSLVDYLVPVATCFSGPSVVPYGFNVMEECTTCGNQIESSARRCPYCEQPQSVVSRPSQETARRRTVTINLKEGRPYVEEALRHMNRRLYEARKDGISVVRLIHGYGSSGTGGAIKQGVRTELAVALRLGSIKEYVGGEDYQHSKVGRRLRSRFPELKECLKTDQGNPGITLVEV